jgi:hypothetical protein
MVEVTEKVKLISLVTITSLCAASFVYTFLVAAPATSVQLAPQVNAHCKFYLQKLQACTKQQVRSHTTREKQCEHEACIHRFVTRLLCV